MAVRRIRKESYDDGYELIIEPNVTLENRRTHKQYQVISAHDGYIKVDDLWTGLVSYINNDDLTESNYFNVVQEDGSLYYYD